MGQEIDDAYHRFCSLEAELKTSFAGVVNESDTRLRLVDRLLIEVLGWHQDSISTEPPTPEGYIDYLLRTGRTQSAFVIEAKRKGRLEPDTNNNGVAYLALNGRVLAPVLPTVKQALRYANDEGIPYAAVTDGSCWLFFRASRTDGKKPLDGRGILFRNLDAVKASFPVFLELLSSVALVEKRNSIHFNKAEGLTVAAAEEHFFISDPKSARLLQPSTLASDASLMFSQFFKRLTDEQDDEMLSFCFVESPESRRADSELEKIAENLVNSIIALDTQEGVALQQEVQRTLYTKRSETVLIIGNKGSGKSTFLKRFFRKILAPSLRSQCTLITVDLEGYHGSKEDVSTWLLRLLRDKVESAVISSTSPSYDELMGVFWEEYDRWRKGPYRPLYDTDKDAFKIEFGKHIESLRKDEPDAYVRALLQRSIKANQKLPCLIFDNTDQFSMQIQDQVYQLAHSLGVSTPVFTLVPITDRTIWRHGKAGALQSYSARTFYLPVPDAKEIIYKRVSFVKDKLADDPAAAHAYFSARGFQVGVADLTMIAQAIERVLVQQDYVSGLIGRLANFDIRRMLELAQKLFLSPEIRIDDILRAHFSGRAITADRYRTYRALLKGEYDRFAEAHNEFVTNLFLVNPRRPSSPLLPLYVVWLLRSRFASSRESVEERHWAVSEICDYFEICGAAEDVTMECLHRLHRRRLIEEFDPNTDSLSRDSRVAIKEAGVAHLDLVLTSSTYMEQMALSSGLSERAVRDQMKELLRRPNAQSFTDIRNLFIAYVLRTDAGRMTIPSSQDFRQLQEVRNRLRDLRTVPAGQAVQIAAS